MDERNKLVVGLVLAGAALFAVWPASDPVPVRAPTVARLRAPFSVSTAPESSPTGFAPAEAPEQHAAWPGVTDWVPMVPLALSVSGLSALGPWQGEEEAAVLLCEGSEVATPEALDAWAEATLWNRESRRVWFISRRLHGQDRLDAVASFVGRAGIDDCPTLSRMEQAWATGQEAAVLPPLYGDPARIAVNDRHALERLRQGLSTVPGP